MRTRIMRAPPTTTSRRIGAWAQVRPLIVCGEVQRQLTVASWWVLRHVYSRATVSRACRPEHGRELATGSVEEMTAECSGRQVRLDTVQKVLTEQARHALAPRLCRRPHLTKWFLSGAVSNGHDVDRGDRLSW